MSWKVMKYYVLIISIVSTNLSCATILPIRTDNGISYTICVPDNYSTIQDAIDHSKNNDKIYIKSGIYKGNIVISKQVSLIGESPETVILIPDEKSNECGISFNINNDISLLFSDPMMIHPQTENIQINSLQIRNFKIGIKIEYQNIALINNCIIVPPINDSIIYGTSIWLQGTKTRIANCTLIGEIQVYNAKPLLNNNIIVHPGILTSENGSDFIIENAIIVNEKSICIFENNLIWGEVEGVINEKNTFANPEFGNVQKYDFLSPYSKKGIGAHIEGTPSESVKITENKPIITFGNDILTDDINICSKQSIELKISVVADSPIKNISIATEEIDFSKKYHFQRTKYKEEVIRTVLLNNGYNTIHVTAEDLVGNSAEKDVNLLYGESSIPKSAWSDITKNESDNVKNMQFKNKYGLVIGIQKYSNELPKIDYSENDAKSIYEVLQNKNYLMMPILLSPTLKQMEEALVKLENIEQENDKIVIYISGHGSNKTSLFSETNGLILPSDANINMLSTTSLSFDNFRTYIRKLKAKSVVIILDMCFAGSGKGYGTIGKNDDKNYITETLKDSGKGKILLASSGDMEESFEDKTFKHGVFTYYLLEAIKNNKKSIDAIYEYIYNSINADGKYSQHPRKVFLSNDVEGVHLLF